MYPLHHGVVLDQRILSRVPQHTQFLVIYMGWDVHQGAVYYFPIGYEKQLLQRGVQNFISALDHAYVPMSRCSLWSMRSVFVRSHELSEGHSEIVQHVPGGIGLLEFLLLSEL